jgi:hypothetical protein
MATPLDPTGQTEWVEARSSTRHVKPARMERVAPMAKTVRGAVSMSPPERLPPRAM